MIFLIFKDEIQYKDQQLLFKIQTIVKSHQKLQELFSISYDFKIAAITLNISIGHQRMFSKKSSYVLQKLLHNGHICPVWSQKKLLVTDVLKFCSGFSSYDHFNRQFIYAVFFILKTVRCVWVKRFCTTNMLFFCPAWDNFHSENILYATT